MLGVADAIADVNINGHWHSNKHGYGVAVARCDGFGVVNGQRHANGEPYSNAAGHCNSFSHGRADGAADAGDGPSAQRSDWDNGG